jgi:hypothetical protein
MAKIKDALQDLIGMPLLDVLKKYGGDLTKEEAELLRKLTDEDLENMRKSDTVIGEALGESGGGEGCGVYY